MAETPKMHPLDAAELALKQAARAYDRWENAECAVNTNHDAHDAKRDAAWATLKSAARRYGDSWAKYVAPAEE